jgi:hypothetical protein
MVHVQSSAHSHLHRPKPLLFAYEVMNVHQYYRECTMYVGKAVKFGESSCTSFGSLKALGKKWQVNWGILEATDVTMPPI